MDQANKVLEPLLDGVDSQIAKVSSEMVTDYYDSGNLRITINSVTFTSDDISVTSNYNSFVEI